MLRINCPFCGMRDHEEFSYEGDASVVYPEIENQDEQAWYRAVFLRKNPKGLHREYWYHSGGCRMWLEVERDTLTHEITKVTPAHDGYQKMVKKSGGKTS